MLCPDCRTAAPGGSTCPRCGHTVPERETFSGEGGRYLLVLTGVAVALLALTLLVRAVGLGGESAVRLFGPGWGSLFTALVGIPLLMGIYFWYVLREEEITVTDEAIERRSRWGDEQLPWEDVRSYRHRAFPIRQTRLGRITWLSRFFPRGQPEPLAPSRWSGSVYELVGPADGPAPARVLRLEPGTISDMAWLLELIQERVGAPQED